MLNIKKGFLVIIPFVLYGNSFNIEAAGKSYGFSASGADSSYLDFKFGDSRGWGVTEYYLGDAYFGYMSPYEDDPATNFLNVNSNISGQFSYDTRKNLATSLNGVNYRDIDFSLNLNSELGGKVRANIENTNAQASYSDDFFSSGPASFFSVSSYSWKNNIEIGGCGIECGSNSYQFSFYSDQIKNDYPVIFAGVYGIDLEVHIDSSYASYYLDELYLHQSQTRNNRVDQSLSPILEGAAGYLDLNFDLNTNMGVAQVEVTYLEDDGSCDVDGCFSDETVYQSKKAEIESFLNNELGLNIDLKLSYNLDSMEEKPAGGSSLDPILPTVSIDKGFQFTLNASSDEFTFIDPEVAVGYDYELLEGANFLAVIMPEGLGDNLYDLWLFDDVLGEFVDSGIDLLGGQSYEFDEGGLNLFRILGIEVDENLDPADPEAFVTGLKFVSEGEVTMSQTALTQTVVPVPPSILFFLTGIVGLYFRKLV